MVKQPGLYDMTMLRFDPNQKVGDKEYMRSDGTLSYFFCLETVRKLFTDAGLKEVIISISFYFTASNVVSIKI